jgi:hypothetical protein
MAWGAILAITITSLMLSQENFRLSVALTVHGNLRANTLVARFLGSQHPFGLMRFSPTISHIWLIQFASTRQLPSLYLIIPFNYYSTILILPAATGSRYLTILPIRPILPIPARTLIKRFFPIEKITSVSLKTSINGYYPLPPPRPPLELRPHF